MDKSKYSNIRVKNEYLRSITDGYITASTNNLVVIEQLSLNTLGSGASITNLGIDSNGFVVNGGVNPIQYWTSGSTGNYSLKVINNSVTDATGDYAVAEGFGNIASGDFSHAEGQATIASGWVSHSEGSNTTASGYVSHAGGSGSTASGDVSFIHSNNSLVSGNRSVVLGGQNITGTTDDTVYVPNFNINYPPLNDNLLSQVLVRATDGTVKYKDINSFTDMTVTGGTYNPSTGVATFTNNSGGTFTVSGFLTGLTDTYTTGVTINGTTLEFNRTDSSNAYSVNLSGITQSKYAASIPFTGGTSQTVTHNLNDTDVIVQLKDSTGKLIIPDEVNNYTLNSVDIKVSSTETFRVIIIG